MNPPWKCVSLRSSGCKKTLSALNFSKSKTRIVSRSTSFSPLGPNHQRVVLHESRVSLGIVLATTKGSRRRFSQLEPRNSGQHYKNKTEQTVSFVASDFPSRTQRILESGGHHEKWLVDLDFNSNTPCLAWPRGRGRQNAP